MSADLLYRRWSTRDRWRRAYSLARSIARSRHDAFGRSYGRLLEDVEVVAAGASVPFMSIAGVLEPAGSLSPAFERWSLTLRRTYRRVRSGQGPCLERTLTLQRELDAARRAVALGAA